MLKHPPAEDSRMVQSMHWQSTRRSRDIVDDRSGGDLLSPLEPPSSSSGRWAFGSSRSHISSLYGAGCFLIGEDGRGRLPSFSTPSHWRKRVAMCIRSITFILFLTFFWTSSSFCTFKLIARWRVFAFARVFLFFYVYLFFAVGSFCLIASPLAKVDEGAPMHWWFTCL